MIKERTEEKVIKKKITYRDFYCDKCGKFIYRKSNDDDESLNQETYRDIDLDISGHRIYKISKVLCDDCYNKLIKRIDDSLKWIKDEHYNDNDILEQIRRK